MQKNILEYLKNTVRTYQNKTAIIDEKGNISFQCLQKQSKNIASYLQSKNINRNLPIGIFLPKSIEAIKSFLGIVYNGDFYVPLDIKNPISRIEAIIKNLDLKYIITDIDNAKLLDELKNIEIILLDDINFEKNIEFDFTNYNLSIDTDPAYIINTSGSTGTPKGVVVSHRSVIDYIDWSIETFKIDSSFKIGNQAPFIFDNSVLDIYLMLSTGATLNLIPENLFIFPLKLIEYLENEKINFIFWVPSIMANIVTLDLLKNRNLELRFVSFAGEIMPTKIMNYWKNYIPNALFVNLYGPTEITVDCTYFIVNRDFKDDEPLPIGYPCKNTDILVLDDKNNLVTKINSTGELCVRGSSLALGYYNDFERTANVFTQNPLNKSYPEKIYRTGDIVCYNELGELIYKGRKDFQIKHIGYRIELGEIETAILSISEINNACILYDEENKHLVLIYESSSNITKNEILVSLSDKLPKYMIPNKFILLDKIPLNVSGKIDRSYLKKEYLKGEK
ncbi:amino acid adenylation domain-containing protein [Aliarcobacter cryaerophilus]|uniref:amino acid adenylation domain-containing protein n=1 Tax=Aliarcobacter cryaerophilus TaxID=28198 RepID=UPI00112F72FA|nr:amino acid adenylation domain-containing protein [Aliarcobacter cryaerophilus]